MTIAEARELLLNGGEWSRLVEAIWALTDDKNSSLADLLLGLPHPGLVSEHAAIALYRRTGRPRPENGGDLVTDPEDWIVWLLENRKCDANERLRVLLAASAAAAARIKPEVATKLAAAIDQAAK